MKIPPAIFAFAVQLLDSGRYAEALAMARIEWEADEFDAGLWRLTNRMFLAQRFVGNAVLSVLVDALDNMTWAIQ